MALAMLEPCFPFSLPGPTRVYVLLMIATFALHILFAQFVLAGTAAVAWGSMRAPGRTDEVRRRLVDWLPFATGMTITFGVAPLLFVQLVDREGFYTANLLLFQRWMALLPVLIVTFYLMYVQKASARVATHAVYGRVLPLLSFCGIAFVALSFSENHLLSQERASWVDFYASRSTCFATPELWPRFGVMLTLSFVSLHVGATCLGLRSVALRVAALVGGTLAVGIAILVPPRDGVEIGDLGLWPAVTLGCAGVTALGIALPIRRPATVASAWALCMIGIATFREAVRWARSGSEALQAQHEHAWSSGGGIVFGTFAILVAGVLGILFVRVRRDLHRRPT